MEITNNWLDSLEANAIRVATRLSTLRPAKSRATHFIKSGYIPLDNLSAATPIVDKATTLGTILRQGRENKQWSPLEAPQDHRFKP